MHHPAAPASELESDAEAARRAEAVKRAMVHAWRGYERFAMGAPELHPVSRKAKQDVLGGSGISGLGVTVVDAMSTLHLMGLQEDFDRWAAHAWVCRNSAFQALHCTSGGQRHQSAKSDSVDGRQRWQ